MSPEVATSVSPDLAALAEHARRVRLAVLDQAEIAKIGHYGPALSATDILVALYYGLLEVSPDSTAWEHHDKFVMSKGHACSALYPILAEKGFFDTAQLATFTRLGSILGDHPDMKIVPGIDFSSGSLGHGVSVAAGFVEALRLRGARRRVAVMIGDGEQNEGQIWEAASYAGHRRLSELLVVCDKNDVCVDGYTRDVMTAEPMADRWKAFGWNVEEVDGHDLAALLDAFGRYDRRRVDPAAGPTLVVARTVSGKGVDFIEGTASWHLGYIAGEDYRRAVAQIEGVAR